MNPENIGYIATGLLILSFSFKNVMWIRIVNTAGCFAFCTYSAIIGAWPVFIGNAFIIIINFYHLLIAPKFGKKITIHNGKA
ncbi:MAG: hypothetical protein ACRC9X_04990 [Bacteroidales bacterium]